MRKRRAFDVVEFLPDGQFVSRRDAYPFDLSRDDPLARRLVSETMGGLAHAESPSPSCISCSTVSRIVAAAGREREEGEGTVLLPLARARARGPYWDFVPSESLRNMPFGTGRYMRNDGNRECRSTRTSSTRTHDAEGRAPSHLRPFAVIAVRSSCL